MAAAQRRFSLLLLLAALLLPAHPPFCLASRELDRRFAPRKRYAEPECSKLMCRGKATQDFRGPDCRFVNIKEGETVYVYYKLTGGSAELWAGSVGNEFGYFPKDLLEINLVYTIDELELPTDETDFVCFDGGKDNFDNYNVEELLKSSEEILANGSETKVDTPEMEVTKKEEELQSDDTVPEPGTEEKNDDLAKMDEKDGYVEGVLDTKRDGLAVNRNTENPQGDQIVHQPLEGMLQEKLKGLDRENAKNSSIPQGEANQSDKRSEEIDAYTLLHREMSKDLKTKFGSTADALVSDDETTRLVTSLEDDFNEDLDFDSHNGEKLEDLKQKSEEIPLLLFIGEKETESPVDPEAEKFSLDENPDFESEKHDLDETTRDTAELINQRGNENKDDSGLLTLGDKIFAIVSGGERKNDETDADKTDSEEEEEDEVILVSKEEKTTLPAHLESLTEDELLKKEMDTVDDQDTKGKNNETQEHEEEFTDRTESDTEEMSNAPMYDPGAFPIHGDGLESKPSIETKQEALKPPLGDIKDDPEGITLHKIMKDKKKTGEKILEDSLDNETKHKTLWGNIKEKKPAGDHQSMHVVPKPLEELQNAFQSDLDDIDLSKGKMEHDTEEQVIQQDGENFELTRVLDKENQTTISAEEKAEIPKEEVKETPTQKDLNNPHEEAVRLENETRNSEKDSELSRSTGMEIPGETIGKRPAVEKSSKTAQVANPHSFTEQETEHGEAEDMDKGLHTDVDREKTSRAELQSEESQPEEENSQNEAEEELLEDENAANAKLSRERLANGHSNKSVMESTKPELEIRERSISGAANPVYETGEEANTADENAKKESSVLDLNEVKDMDEAVQIHEASALNEIVESKLEEVSSLSETEPLVASEVEDSLVKEKTQIQDIHERTLPDDVNSLETADGKDDDNQGEELLPEDLSQKDSKDIQDSMEQANISHQQSDPAGPSDASIIMEEAVEPEYRDSVKQLTIMKEFIDEKRVTRLQNFLGPQHVVRIEALFHDMQLELELACKNNHNHDDTEKALDQILESSESSILDAVDKILESRERENKEEVVKEMDLLDAEAALMDDIQELMYSLRQKYSPVIESVPLVPSQESEKESTAPNTAAAKESTAEETDAEFPQQEEMSKEEILKLSEPKEDGNTLKEIALSDEKETRDVHETEEILPREDSAFVATDSGQSDGENFVPGMTTKDDTVEIEGQPIEASPAVPHILATLDGVVLSAKENMRPITEALISTLPEDIRPGPNFHGLPWEPIIITSLVGITTLAIFFWRTCLSVSIF
uniref:Transport and Golgi organization protein 1 homolog n=1 Tax=Sphenodon punctatus TaxID=8508 RepID=A0A8D0GRG7_SPHPU